LLDHKGTDQEKRPSSSMLEGIPFPVQTEGGRKFVRLELFSPVHFQILTCKNGKLKLSKKKNTAEILNLSEGGLLLATNTMIPTEGFLVTTMNLSGVVTLEGVLGKIKRVESSGDGDFLVGLQFVARKELEQIVTPEEIQRLPVTITSFNQRIREILSSYVRTSELATP
jgi:hypothetical protein